MATNTIKTRIQHKNGSASDWSQATTFVPLKGELIIYNDATTPKIKIGDGTTLVGNLPFVGASITMNGAIASSPNFYAPTSAGTDGQVLKSNGSGAPSWITLGSNAYTSTAYLPLSGGKLKSSTDVPLEISSATEDGSHIIFTNNSGVILGWIGYTGQNNPVINYGSTGTGYTILHSGNTITSGYNLCYGTKNADGWSHNFATTSATSQKETHNGVQCVRFIKDNQTETNWKYTINKNLDLSKLKDSTYYTVSFDVCSSVSGNIALVGIMTDSAVYNLAQEIEYLDNAVTAGIWKRVSFRFKTVNSIANIGLHNQGVYLTTPAITPNSEIVLGRLCVQEGKIPGNYTDYESYYDNITSNNYTSYVPTKTGVGASGTWDINITGVSRGLKRNDNASNTRLIYTNASQDSYGWGQIMYDSNDKACYIYYSTSKDAEAPSIRVYGPDGGTSALVLTTANYTSYVPTRSEVVLAIAANGFYGMAPSGNTETWVRTTTLGIIPYQSGGSSSLGTSSWPFNDAHINIIYGSLQGNASTATRLATLSTTANFYRGDGTWSNIIKQTSSSTLGIDSNLIIGHKIKDLHFDITNGNGSGIDEGNAGGISWGSGSNTYAGIYYQTSGSYGSRLIFATTTTYAGGCYARMIIQNNGQVGINTLSPSYTLHVNGTIYGSTVYGAVWNDYAEYRSQNKTIEPGYIAYCDDDGKLKKTVERLQKYEGVVSDTFGFAIGETDDCKTPLAVSGRVLVYCDPEDHFHSGDCVCAGPDGLAYHMTREEIIEFPDRIVGVVSEIPTYETWGSGNVEVNGRIWIKVK